MPKKKSTSKISSTQDYIDIGEIRDGIIITKEGGLRMILLASAINFDLKSEKEQNALIGQYQNFLNSLEHPIQILMQSRKLDLTDYLEKLKQRSLIEKNQLIKIQMDDYIVFIRRLLSIANIMDKKIYIIIPMDPPSVQSRSFFDKLFNPLNKLQVKISPAEFESYKKQLLERANTVVSGLSPLGIRVIPLNTQQIIELFYSSFNLEEATKEKLLQVDNLESPIIKRQETSQQSSQKEKSNNN